MKIIFNPQKITLSPKLRNRIQKLFANSLGKKLIHYQDDQKVASLAIEKKERSGYEFKFGLILPGCKVFIKETHKVLMDGVNELKDKASRQVQKSLDKLRDR